MKRYGQISSEGFVLVAVPVLFGLLGLLIVAAAPFFLLGLVKRAVVWAWMAGDNQT